VDFVTFMKKILFGMTKMILKNVTLVVDTVHMFGAVNAGGTIWRIGLSMENLN